MQNDVENNIYSFNPAGILKLCSSMINDCIKCYNSLHASNNTCLSKILIEENENYFKDEINNVYISCSVLDNCIKCKSKTECTYCKEGFVVNNNICKKINDENNKLSKGVIAGIVVGCSLFFLLSSGLAYYLISKKNIIKNSDKEDIPEKE